ncbi:MAG TPA: Maf family protein [Solirubrobacteraceae bacterium]
MIDAPRRSGLPRSALILASASPQRRAILEQLGITHEVRPADVPELDTGPPVEVAVENAYRKAAAIAPSAPEALVLGVDTIVSLGQRIFGKPRDEAHARGTLQALVGRRHAVISGVCLIEPGKVRTSTATTFVEFRAVGERMLAWYLATGEWRGRAGAYAIQGAGAALVAGIEGDYLNVVGLPVPTLLELVPSLIVE